MVNQNFTLTRGNSLQFRINFVDFDTLPYNIIFKLKNKYSSQENIFALELYDGITKVEGLDSYDVYIPPQLTENLELLNYIYQISVIYGEDYETVVEGKLIITPEV